MTDLKNQVQGIEANLGARDITELADFTGNIYEALVIVKKRARQLNVDLKSELHQKLEEFASSTETIEEVQENKEQIEISKFYEKLPNPALIALNEFTLEELDYSYPEDRAKRLKEEA